MAQSQKFLVDLDLQGNVLKNVVLGTNAGTDNGAIWFDALNGLVKFIDASGNTQSVAPKSYVDTAVAGEAADRASEITRVEGLIADEAAARALAVSGVQSNLNTEEAARIAGDNALASDIADETTARQAADANLALDIANETSAREAADSALQTAIDAVAADLAALDTNFATDAEVTAAVAVETARAEAAEALLDSAITSANSAISAVASDLSTEVLNRQNAVSAVASDLADEVTARQAADTTLQNNIDDEAAARVLADSNLASDIADEAAARSAADLTLQGNIDSEVSARQAAVSAVASDLADEVSRAQSAEFSLDARIDTLEDAAPTYALAANVAADLASEATRADAYADAAALTAENNAKAYADLIAQGLNVKEGVRTVVALGGGITPAQELEGTYTAISALNDTVGVELQVGDHVIVTDLDGSISGGIYTVQSGAWTLREDWDNDTTKAGTFVFVAEGFYANTAWASLDIANNPSSPVWFFQQMTGVADVYGDSTINVIGNEVSVNRQGMVMDHQMARKATATIGNGSDLSYIVSHDLGDGANAATDLVVSVKEVATGALVQAEVVIGTGTITVSFNSAPGANAMKVTIIG